MAENLSPQIRSQIPVISSAPDEAQHASESSGNTAQQLRVEALRDALAGDADDRARAARPGAIARLGWSATAEKMLRIYADAATRAR